VGYGGNVSYHHCRCHQWDHCRVSRRVFALLSSKQEVGGKAFTSLALGGVTGLTALGVFAINYAATGLINDQGILLFWRFAELYKWGALLLAIIVHWSTTGTVANSVPLSLGSVRLLALSLRLDLLWPMVVVGALTGAQPALRRTAAKAFSGVNCNIEEYNHYL
jgi:hypothetical protein